MLRNIMRSLLEAKKLASTIEGISLFLSVITVLGSAPAHLSNLDQECKIDEGYQGVQTSRYETNKSWPCYVECKEYSQ